MRKNTLAVAAVVALAGSAFAQDAFYTWSNDAAGPVHMGDTVTLTLAVQFTPDPGFGFGSSLFDIIGDDIAGGGDLSNDETAGLGRYFQFSGTFNGVVTGDDILGNDEFQLPQAFGGGDPTNPIVNFYVFTYTVTDETARTVSYTSVHDNTDIYQDSFGTSIPYNIHVTGTSFDVAPIPAPASMALLGLGGLVATRRRR
jgi:MYXO-CTERM domain-containing protein